MCCDLCRNRRGVLAGGAGLATVLLLVTAHAGRTQESGVSDRAVIDVVGDVLPESSWLRPQDGSRIFDGVREEFARADLVFANLEEPITSSKTVTRGKSPAAVRAGRDFVLRSRNPEIPVILKAAGVGLVGLANNHMMDYTSVGLRDTLRAFDKAQLPVVGAGFKPDAERAFVFKAHGYRIALLAFTDVVPTNSEATEAKEGVASSKHEADLVQAIRRARQQADYVVLMMHWGGQGGHLITKRQRELARLAAGAGCDAVVGMHPHVLQGIEFVGRTPVFYSIGNFAFPSSRSDARESLVLRLTFGAQGLETAEAAPVDISPAGAPSMASGSVAQAILAHLDGYCRMFNSRIDRGLVVTAAPRQVLAYDTSGGSPAQKGARRRRGSPKLRASSSGRKGT